MSGEYRTFQTTNGPEKKIMIAFIIFLCNSMIPSVPVESAVGNDRFQFTGKIYPTWVEMSAQNLIYFYAHLKHWTKS